MGFKIYTRTGDDGSTGVMGAERVQKNNPRIKACGAVDELNAVLGICATVAEQANTHPLQRIINSVQHDLFTLGADLGTPLDARASVPRIEDDKATALESNIDALEEDLPALANFILPTGGNLASHLHLARTVCRRAEREVVEASATFSLNPHTLEYLNRLSDLLFVMARWANVQAQIPDVLWKTP